MIVLFRPPPEDPTSADPVSPLKRAVRALGRIPVHGLLWLLAMGYLVSTLLLNPDVYIGSLKGPALGTLLSLGQVAVAFLLFLGLFLIVNLVLVMFYSRLGERPLLFVSLVGLFFTLLVAVNSLPIVVYIEWLEWEGMSPEQVNQAQILSLLMANAMLYYFFYSFFLDIWSEKKKLYAVSAPFKGKSQIEFLRERALTIVLAILSPLFYYIFSFTLFTDLVLQSKSHQGGIVSELYRLARELGFFSSRFIVSFSVMLLFVLPVKFLFDFLQRRVEQRFVL